MTPNVLLGSDDPRELNTFLDARLHAFNVRATGHDDALPLHARVLAADGGIAGAISGHTWGGCCHVVALWVHEAERGRGIGRALLEAAEREALRRGCTQVVLSTHSFQAPGFYEKLGYTCVAQIDDYPRGFSQLFFAKRPRAGA